MVRAQPTSNKQANNQNLTEKKNLSALKWFIMCV